MLAPFGVEQEEKTADDKILIVCFQALTSACPGQGQTDSRTTTHSKFSWFPKLPDSNSQRVPWVTDVPPDAGRHPLRYQSELETGSLVPNFCHGSAVWLKGPKAKCQRGHVITWLYKIYIRQVKLTRVFLYELVFVKLRDYLKRWGVFLIHFQYLASKACLEKGGEAVSYIDFARPLIFDAHGVFLGNLTK